MTVIALVLMAASLFSPWPSLFAVVWAAGVLLFFYSLQE